MLAIFYLFILPLYLLYYRYGDALAIKTFHLLSISVDEIIFMQINCIVHLKKQVKRKTGEICVTWRSVTNYQGSHSDWKTWKMGRHFPVREKSGNFEQTGKVRENHTKY